MAIEASTVRKLVLSRLAEIKQAAAARRARTAEAEAQYAAFLPARAVSVFTLVAQVLSSEGYPYRVTTPGGGVRMHSDRSARTYVDLRLDTAGPAPVLLMEISRERGQRVLVDEHPVGEGAPIAALSEEDVLAALVAAIGDLIER